MIWLLACGGVAPLPVEGQLAPCPSTANCVSSQADPADRVHYVAPLPAMSVEQAVAALSRLGAAAIVVDGTHLRAEGHTRLFTDDIDLIVFEDRVDVRSSSRVGGGDLGVNRARVEALRGLLE